MNSAIQFTNLSKTYTSGFWGKKQCALNGLNLTVAEGSVYGFLGANGAGKTTAIKILMSLQFASSGESKIFGLSNLLPESKAELGFLPERPYFHETMTGAEFLNFHRKMYGKYTNKNKLRTNAELLNLVGLKDAENKQLKNFSKGMLQRIGIAQALVNDPKIIILDEPMSGLDPLGRKEVRELIVRLGDLGKTVFFSTHILSDAELICDRIAFLEKGILKYEGDMSEIKSNGKIELFFDGITMDKLSTSKWLQEAKVFGKSFCLSNIENANIESIIRELWQKGGSIIKLQPESVSLEQFLFGTKS